MRWAFLLIKKTPKITDSGTREKSAYFGRFFIRNVTVWLRWRFFSFVSNYSASEQGLFLAFYLK